MQIASNSKLLIIINILQNFTYQVKPNKSCSNLWIIAKEVWWDVEVPWLLLQGTNGITTVLLGHKGATDELKKNQNLVKRVIQQLSGSNFTQFWSPTPLEWTKIGILQTFYPLSRDPVDFLMTPHGPHPPLLVHVIIEWPQTRNL